MPIRITNRLGFAHPLHVSTKLTERMNEDGSLTFEVIEDDYNKEIVNTLSKMWTVSQVGGPNDDTEYVIIMLDRETIGDRQKIKVSARERHIHDLLRRRYYGDITGTLTAKQYFDEVFKGLDMTYTLSESVPDAVWENAGNGSRRLDMFRDGLAKYGLEYMYDSTKKRYVLKPFFEEIADYYISSEINANKVYVEEDASDIATYIRGYAFFDKDTPYQEAALQIEFRHPLADAIGTHEAEPYINGNITDEDDLKRELEAIIANSLKVSLKVDFLSLTDKFPKAVPKIGHVVQVKNDTLNVMDDVRIVEVSTERDGNNKIKKQDIVLGDFRKYQRYMRAVNTAANFVSSATNGSNPNRTEVAALASKFNQIETNEKGLVLRDESGVPYNVIIQDGQIVAVKI